MMMMMANEVEGASTNMPNWLALPRDIMVNILQRLDTIDVVTSACQVCPQWWNICKDPHVWRTMQINMTNRRFFSRFFPPDLVKICRYAVDRSCGFLIDIDIEFIGTDRLLQYISENASNLRCMKLVECSKISDKGFSEAVRKLPQLEDVNISKCNLSKDSLEVLGRSCPSLKSLQFAKARPSFMLGADDTEALVIATMSTLTRLDIKGNMLTNAGLLAILDGCPLLESLGMEECYHLDLSDSLRKRCLEQIKDLRLPVLDNNYYHVMYNGNSNCHSLCGLLL